MKNNKNCYPLVLLTTFLLICTSCFPTNADDQQYPVVDTDTAIHVAENLLQTMQQTTHFITTSQPMQTNQGQLLCYVFSLQPIGYIVVSAHHDLPPVLAYSFTNTFSGTKQILQELVKTDINQRIQHTQMIPEHIKEEHNKEWDNLLVSSLSRQDDTTFIQWPQQETTLSGGWLETQWHQNSPFNDFCPIDLASGERSVAGCPSLAMAQIYDYHQTTNNVHLNDTDDYYHDYADNTYWIDDEYETYDFIPFHELNAYLDTLNYHYKNQIPITDEDKAALTFACGIAAKQVYHPAGSGTFGVDQAYQAYQRFNFQDIALLDDDDPDVYDRIKQNIQDGLPVHLAVVNENWTVGHNLVIDGYNTYGFYHLNFGWSGAYDGWYQLPEELPFDVTFLEGVIVDINKDNNNSNLQSQDVLIWSNIRPRSTVEGTLTIQNNGEPGSEINWEIITTPTWGEWSFDYTAGENLTPEDGLFSINVSVKIPPGRNKHYNGYVKVIDVDNENNSCLIHASLTTPHLLWKFHRIQLFLQKHPTTFPLLRQILNL